MNAKRSLSLLLALLLTLSAVCVASMSSCGKKDTGTQTQKTITVKVTDNEGKETSFTIKTDAEFLRGALEQEKLIEGEESQYGLYVKVVNGVTADYNTDGAYWGFYKGGEYLMTGVDETPIKDGDTFEIVYTKG